jgi:hypothetical protein
LFHFNPLELNLAFSEWGMYHKFLPTPLSPSPPYRFYLLVYPTRVYPHGYPYSTVRLYSGLDANDSHLRFMQ